jgi:lipid-binding SYLF domain-containing protein
VRLPRLSGVPRTNSRRRGAVQSFVDNGNNGLDGVVPRSILERARGFAIFSVVKAGFIVSARAGSGVVIARLNDGCTYAPAYRKQLCG